LRRLHTNSGKLDVDESDLSREAAEIKHTVDEEREAAAGNSFKTLLKDGTQKFRYRTLLGIGGQFMQQLSGKWSPMSDDGYLILGLCIVS
jgi:hypothetical protein